MRQLDGIIFPSNDPIYLQAPPTWFSQIVSSTAWLEGQAMSLEQVIAYALASEEM